MHEALAALFDIDKSDPATGIKISLKKPELPLATPASPTPDFTYTPDTVHIVNGRVVFDRGAIRPGVFGQPLRFN